MNILKLTNKIKKLEIKIKNANDLKEKIKLGR